MTEKTRMKPIAVAMAVVLAGMGICRAEETGKQSPFEIQAGEGKFKFYGFLRADAQYDDSKPNDPQLIAFVRSEDDTLPLSATVARPGDSQFNIHPKLTRFGFDMGSYTVKSLGSAKVSGKIELDFFNTATSESRTALRM